MAELAREVPIKSACGRDARVPKRALGASETLACLIGKDLHKRVKFGHRMALEDGGRGCDGHSLTRQAAFRHVDYMP